jgi:hypothetical protein
MRKLHSITQVIIFLSAILLGVETFYYDDVELVRIFKILDYSIVLYFIFEIVMRFFFLNGALQNSFYRTLFLSDLYYNKVCITSNECNAKFYAFNNFKKIFAKSFQKDSALNTEEINILTKWIWFALDAFIALMSVLAIFLLHIEHPEFVFLGRFLRIFRLIRLFEANEAIRSIESKIAKTIPTIIMFSAFLFIIIYSYAIIGIMIFEHKTYENIDFSNLYNCTISLFSLLIDNWPGAHLELKEKSGLNLYIVDFYMISYIVISFMITLNVFIAILTNQVWEMVEKERHQIELEKIKKGINKEIASSEKKIIGEIEKNDAENDKEFEKAEKRILNEIQELKKIVEALSHKK